MRAWPSLLGALGGVALGFGLTSALLALFQPLMPIGWVVGNLLLGTLLLGVSMAKSFGTLRERLGSGAMRRRAAHGTHALVTVVLALAIIGMLAFLSTRYSHRLDWTEQQVNTLSRETLALADGLEVDVQLTAFFKERDSIAVRDLLDRYAHASDRLEVRFVDPNVRPDLVEAHQLEEGELARGLILATTGSGESASTVRITTPSEVDITNALSKLLRATQRKVYVVSGHGERLIETPAAAPSTDSLDEASGGAPATAETAEGRAGIARAVAALRKEGFEIEALLLPTAERIPADADAVVIAGPTRLFLEPEIDMLDRYLAEGGAVMVMIDPRARTNLYDRVRAWGADIGEDVVVDPVLSLLREPTAPLAGAYAEGHPIVASLGRTVFPMARSVTTAEASGLVPVVFTAASSWAERDLETWIGTGRAMLDDGDLAGPVPLAVAGRPARDAASAGVEAGRLFVIGDSSFATNEYLDAFANRDLLLNAVSWLVGEEAQIVVRPNVARASTVELTEGQFQAIQYLSLFLLPEGIALLGVLMWWSRRRPAGNRLG